MNVSTDGRIERSVTKYVAAGIGRSDLRLRSGDVLFNNTNSPELVGKTALFEDEDEPGFSNHMTRLRTDPTLADPAFIAIRLHHAWRDGWFAAHCNNHVSQASIGRDVLQAFPIELPPLDVQRQIAQAAVTINERRRSGTDHLEAASESIERLRQSVLAAAYSGRLTSDWREGQALDTANPIIEELAAAHIAVLTQERTSKQVAQSVTDLNPADFPSTWRVAPLKLLCEPGRPITYGILKPGPHVEAGVPYVRVTDFKSGEVELPALKRTTTRIAGEYRRSTLRGGDILFAIRGSYGHVAIVPPALEGGNITQDTARLSIHPMLSTEFLRLALSSPGVHSRVERAAKGVAVQGVNLGDLRELLLPIPPRPEQDEIVRRVHELLSLANSMQEQVDAAARSTARISEASLTKALRGDLFAGASDRE